MEMKPIVHGLGAKYRGKVDILFLDVSDQRNRDLGLSIPVFGTPHLVLLRSDGRIARDWNGVTSGERLDAAIRDVLAQGGAGTPRTDEASPGAPPVSR
jgi:hypothetical protein